jgi:hypothetical protein
MFAGESALQTPIQERVSALVERCHSDVVGWSVRCPPHTLARKVVLSGRALDNFNERGCDETKYWPLVISRLVHCEDAENEETYAHHVESRGEA